MFGRADTVTGFTTNGTKDGGGGHSNDNVNSSGGGRGATTALTVGTVVLKRQNGDKRVLGNVVSWVQF